MAVYLGTNKVSMTGLTDLSGASIVNNQNKTVSASTSQQTITADAGYTGLGTVTINAAALQTLPVTENGTYTPSSGYYGIGTVNVNVPQGSTINNQNKTVTPTTSQQSITADSGYTGLGTVTVNAIPTGMAGTPTATKGTVSNHSISVTPSVTNTTGYITGSTKTGTAVTVTASELASGNKSITANGNNIDVVGYSTVSVNVGGVEYTRTVIAPQQTVTPNSSRVAQLSNTTPLVDGEDYIVTLDGVEWFTTSETLWASNYIIGDPNWFLGTPSTYIYPFAVGTEGSTTEAAFPNTSQHTIKIERLDLVTDGTTLTTKTITQNGTYSASSDSADGYSQVVVNVSGGSSSSPQVGLIEGGTSTASSISFTGLQGEPIAYDVVTDYSIATGTPAKIAALTFDGTNIVAQTVTNTTNAQISSASSSNFTHSYNNGTLTITSTGPSFVTGISYFLTYVYGGSSSCVYTATPNTISSGVTSATYSELEGEPIYWSCLFEGSFGTSTGYQRVVFVNYDGNNLVGVEMDSSAKPANHWTTSYSDGTLVITSNGTNQGGYFHNSGTYNLIYVIDNGSGSGSSITTESLSVTTNGTYTAPSGKAYTPVYVNVPQGSTINNQNKTVTPTTSQQSITADSGYTGLGTVTVNAIPNTYVQPASTIGATTYRASTSNQTISAGTYHSAAATIAAVTQTNLTAANIKSGTTVTISNGQSNLWSITGTYEGSGSGGGDAMQIATSSKTLTATASSISFTGLSGQPTSFAITSAANISTNTTGVAEVVYDGTNVVGQTITTQVTYDDSSFSQSYSNGTLTVSSTSANFQANEYTLVYTYGGSSSNIDTASQPVGSGATSVTFTGLSDEPDYFACIFTGGFSISSGYQRVIGVVYDGDTTYGMAMDSAAKPQTSWSYTYNNGSLTITSSGTNNGGYFHMDGTIPYYLVYATGAGESSSGNYQTKSVTYTPSTTQQTATIQADSGYDALKKVNITVNAMTSMTLPTASSAYSSGTLKATITPTSSVQYINIPVGYNSTAQYYTISAASGGGSASIGSKTLTPSNRPTSIQFTSMSGSPKAFTLRCTAAMSRSSNSSYYYVAHIRYNGTNTYGNCWRMSNGNWTNITSGYSFSYSGTTLTITSSGSTTTSPGCFYPGEYELIYIY